jgi:hypothetical protein
MCSRGNSKAAQRSMAARASVPARRGGHKWGSSESAAPGSKIIGIASRVGSMEAAIQEPFKHQKALRRAVA